MFSGLVAYLGQIESISGDARRGMRLVVTAPQAIADGIAVKDSVAVNGVCLTAVAVDATTVAFDVVPETVHRSTIGALVAGSPVNLELSLRLGDRLGGHFVYGHVDATARIVAKDVEGQGHRLHVAVPPSVASFIVEKGYVALDGVSLTVAAVTPGHFSIALIPETSKRTTLGRVVTGSAVNLEVDPVARYAQAAVAAYAPGASRDELAWAYEI